MCYLAMIGVSVCARLETSCRRLLRFALPTNHMFWKPTARSDYDIIERNNNYGFLQYPPLFRLAISLEERVLRDILDGHEDSEHSYKSVAAVGASCVRTSRRIWVYSLCALAGMRRLEPLCLEDFAKVPLFGEICASKLCVLPSPYFSLSYKLYGRTTQFGRQVCSLYLHGLSLD